MSLIDWHVSLDTGIGFIDEQHRELVRLLNDIYDRVLDCPSLDAEKALTGSFLRSLHSYANKHFTAEEAFLLRHDYPGLPEHTAEHLAFILDLEELQDKYAKGEPALSFEIFQFIRNWLLSHIGETDQQYVAHCSAIAK